MLNFKIIKLVKKIIVLISILVKLTSVDLISSFVGFVENILASWYHRNTSIPFSRLISEARIVSKTHTLALVTIGCHFRDRGPQDFDVIVNKVDMNKSTLLNHVSYVPPCFAGQRAICSNLPTYFASKSH